MAEANVAAAIESTVAEATASAEEGRTVAEATESTMAEANKAAEADGPKTKVRLLLQQLLLLLQLVLQLQHQLLLQPKVNDLKVKVTNCTILHHAEKFADS